MKIDLWNLGYNLVTKYFYNCALHISRAVEVEGKCFRFL